ncbi:MAG: H-type small acid-soluble spore protein [Syntrophomonadaceae bacterium]|jgi:H-type small acid-soluble spore protein
MMHISRAREIVESAGVHGVAYKGSPVWIEEIREDMAIVRDLQTHRQEPVPIAELKEI